MGLKESDFRILNPFRDFKANSRKRVQFPMHCIALNTIYRRLQWPHNRSLQRQSGMPRRAVQQSGKLHASDASFHSDVLQFSSLESRSQRSLFSTILPKFHSLMIQLLCSLSKSLSKFPRKLMPPKWNLIRMQLIKSIPYRFRALQSLSGN